MLVNMVVELCQCVVLGDRCTKVLASRQTNISGFTDCKSDFSLAGLALRRISININIYNKSTRAVHIYIHTYVSKLNFVIYTNWEKMRCIMQLRFAREIASKLFPIKLIRTYYI